MRQKKHDYRLMSTTACSKAGCRTLLKKNVIERKPTGDLCYKHHLLKKKQMGKK